MDVARCLISTRPPLFQQSGVEAVVVVDGVGEVRWMVVEGDGVTDLVGEDVDGGCGVIEGTRVVVLVGVMTIRVSVALAVSDGVMGKVTFAVEQAARSRRIRTPCILRNCFGIHII